MSGANTKRAWKLRKLPTLLINVFIYAIYVFGTSIGSNNNNFEFKWQVN